MADTEYRNVSVDLIRRGRFQPRRHFDEDALRELADTIARHGLVEPLVLRPVDGGYELLAGERRWRAAQLAGLHQVPATIRDVDDSQAAEIALIENIQRENLNAMETARALQSLMDDHGYTQQEAADHVGKSRTVIANHLRLLSMPGEVQEMVSRGELNMGLAKTLPGRDRGQQITLARNAVRFGWTARQMEREIQKLDRPAQHAAKEQDAEQRELDRLASEWSEHLGSSVKIERDGKGGYITTIRAANADILTGQMEKTGYYPG